MRFDSLNLKAFGPYTNARLSFEPRMTIVYGPNEAGKSSLLRAVLAVLFGVPERTRDNFRHDYAQLRIGASLSRRDGQKLAFTRRKGKVATVLDEDGKPLDDRSLARFCGPIDEALYTALFCLDHGRLRQGGSTLLAGGGEVGHSLFEAGTGLLGLKNVLLQMEKEARDLFRPQGSQPAINRALARHSDARKKLKEHLLRGEDWKKLRQTVDEARLALQGCTEELRAMQQQAERLQRIARNRPLVARRERARQDLALLADVPLLTPEASQQRVRASADGQAGRDQMGDIQAAQRSLRLKLEGLTIDEAVLAHGLAIENLFAALGGYRDATQDLPQRLGKRLHYQSMVEAAQVEIPAVCLERPLLPAASARLRDLIKRQGPLLARVEEVEIQQAELENAMQSDREKLAGLPPAVEPADLRASLETLRGQGDIEKRWRDTQAAVTAADSQVQAALASLPWWQGTAEAFQRLAFPGRETLERFEQEGLELEGERRRLDQEARGLLNALDESAAERSALEATGEIATLDRVKASRAYRDHTWDLIQETYIERTRPPEHDLVGGYTRSVSEADRLVDALHADAARVTEFAMLSRRLQGLAQQRDMLAGERERWQARQGLFAREWTALWQSIGITAATPRECLGWLARREDILRRVAEAQSLASSLSVLARQLQEARHLLGATLAALGLLPLGPGDLLAARLGQATRCLDSLEARNRRRQDLEQALQQREQAQSAARPRWQSARDHLLQWQAAWTLAVGPLSLPAEAVPAEVERLLDCLDEVARNTARRSEEQRRIDGISERVGSFTGQVVALTATLSPGLAAGPPDAAVEALYQRLSMARRVHQTLEDVTAQLQQKDIELENARRKTAAAMDCIERLCQEARCTPEELPGVEARSAQKRLLLAEVESLEGQLIAQNGAGLAGVLEETATEDGDSLPGRLAATREREAALEQSRQVLTARYVEFDLMLKGMDGSDHAALAAEEAQEALADLRDGAESYIRLQASSFVLRRAIEEYRERNQGPLLRRSSELFGTLTGGSFVAVRTGFDEKDKLILVGVRPDGSEVAVEGMSEGTVDQLYLALRLAAIERQVSHSEPLPVILDDILVHFDDARAQAALGVIEALSQQTQVLFFTHHEHLVRLAEQTLGTGVQVLRLGADAPWPVAMAV